MPRTLPTPLAFRSTPRDVVLDCVYRLERTEEDMKAMMEKNAADKAGLEKQIALQEVRIFRWWRRRSISWRLDKMQKLWNVFF